MTSAACFSELPETRGSGYERDLLVQSFVVRHWSPWLCGSENGLPETVRIAQMGMEVYYQSARSLIRRVTEQHFVALDLGCAAGRMTCELAWSGAARVIGVDKSSRMLNWARKIAWTPRSQSISVPVPLTASRTTNCYISGMEMRNRTAFVIGDAQTIPLPACSVHLICCMNVLHRLPRPDRVLREIQRVLKPDGYLVISNDYDWNDDFTPLRRLWFDDFRAVLPRDVWETLDEIDPVPYEAPVHGRKVTRALNHLMLIRKRR